MARPGYKALLIGNSTFPEDAQNLQTLEGPVNDITSMKAALTNPVTGLFAENAVRVVPERTVSEVLVELERFFSTGRREDTLLLYYSGHGLLDTSNQLFLCARDTRTDLLKATSVSARDINEMIDESPAQTTVIVLDCCHSGAFKGGDFPASLRGSGRYLITSCRSGQLANDAIQENGRSVFTNFLVDGLSSAAPDLDGDGFVTLDDLYEYVHQKLAELDKQIPQRSFSGGGDVPIATRTAIVPGPAPASVPPPAPEPTPTPASPPIAPVETPAITIPVDRAPRDDETAPGPSRRQAAADRIAAAPIGRSQIVPMVVGAGIILGFIAIVAWAAVSIFGGGDSPGTPDPTPGPTATPDPLFVAPVSPLTACTPRLATDPPNQAACGDTGIIAASADDGTANGCLQLRHYPSTHNEVVGGVRYYGTPLAVVCRSLGQFTINADVQIDPDSGNAWFYVIFSTATRVQGWIDAGNGYANVDGVGLASAGRAYGLECDSGKSTSPAGATQYRCGDHVRIDATPAGATCLDIRHYQTYANVPTSNSRATSSSYHGALIDCLAPGTTARVISDSIVASLERGPRDATPIAPANPADNANQYSWLRVVVDGSDGRLDGFIPADPNRGAPYAVVIP